MVSCARQARLPILGICRGAQILNVAYGGTLIGDIQESSARALNHMGAMPSCRDADEIRTCLGAYHHHVTVAKGCWLSRMFGAQQLEVNSFHHQAVDPNGIGAGLRPCAWAPDGTIEAIEGTDIGHFVVGVQWHPEMLVHFGDSFWKTFFQQFVDVCREHD